MKTTKDYKTPTMFVIVLLSSFLLVAAIPTIVEWSVSKIGNLWTIVIMASINIVCAWMFFYKLIND